MLLWEENLRELSGGWINIVSGVFTESISKPCYSFQVLLGRISRYDQKNHVFLA